MKAWIMFFNIPKADCLTLFFSLLKSKHNRSVLCNSKSISRQVPTLNYEYFNENMHKNITILMPTKVVNTG